MVQIGARGCEARFSQVRLYRDVFYTPSPDAEGHDTFSTGADGFVMLGDNSPLSLDSRGWEIPVVPRHLLIGKPFVVHLPSRQGQITLMGQTHHIRIPDVARVRYIP